MRYLLLGMFFSAAASAQPATLLSCYERIGNSNLGRGYWGTVSQNEEGKLLLDITMCEKLWHGECFGDSKAIMERLEVVRAENGFQAERGGLVQSEGGYLLYVNLPGSQGAHRFAKERCVEPHP